MLKYKAILLSVYLLLLALVPCGDRQECNVAENEITYVAQTAHNQHEHTVEICSPFCICACCGQLVHASHQTLVQIKAVIAVTRFQPLYKARQFTEPGIAIWQPPKLI